ncbi:aminopeptidase N [Sphingoaurantiacus capsulatus]|uniref:Aminopeptidase N n=1 Tax=Sphingoaurantiacus capsulatus TaxID=1771310 RepID=A0ABV7XC52_9SPHN
MLDAASTPQVTRLADYRPPAWTVPAIALDFDLDDKATRVTSRLTVERGEGGPLVLDGEGLRLISLSVDGKPLGDGDYSYADDKLTITLNGDSHIVESVVEISPIANTQLMGLYASEGMLCTQCEAEGFRRITFFPDRPDVLSRFTVKMTADKARYPVLLSNGNRVAAGEGKDGRHWAEWEDPFPKPCYLFALVAGDLSALKDEFVTASGRKVELGIWVREADVPRCRHAMDALKSSMRWDEQVYGREYDLDLFNIVAVSDFNFGAMENKGLNIFNSKYILADADTATDLDFDNVAAVVAHEYFHNWTGNRITCRDWFQLSLKEGLTVYRDQEFSADHGSRAVKRIEDVRMLRAVQFQEDSGPLAHPVRPESYMEISNFYTATIYNKGAEVIRMLATLLGADRYRAGCDLYFDRHDGQAVTIEDWVKAHEDANGLDLTQFRRWYAQAGTPRVAVSSRYDAASKSLEIDLAQSTPPTPGQDSKAPFHIPLDVALFGRDSGARLGDPRLIELKDSSATIRLDDVAEPPVLSINRGFSAPIAIDAPQTREELAHLSAHDDDPFARYEALQRLALLTLTDAIRRGDEVADPALVDAVAATLDSGLDPAFIGEAVLLPSEAFIGDQMPTVDPDAIHGVREATRRTLGSQLNDRWWSAYRANRDNRYELNPEAKGRRRLKNVALGYLVADADPKAVSTTFEQFGDADNMTDRLAALGLLTSLEVGEREAALAAFHARYKNDPLVLDKWFATQALSTHPDALDQVIALSRHADFSRTNPNRFRALIGSFGANQPRFHAADGGGYAFLANEVLAVDGLNSQSAARMVQPLTRWRRFGADRAALMRAELERILATPGLSKDVYEVVSKGLA